MPSLHFETLIDEIQHIGQLMLEFAKITQAIHREGRSATASELTRCRELKQALDQNFKQIMTLMHLMEHRLAGDQDNGTPKPKH